MTQIQNKKSAMYASGIVDFMTLALKANLVPFVKGSPGIGKSDIARKVAERFNLKLIDFRLAQCDPTDLNGFPHTDPATGRASYKPMSIWPLKDDPLPVRENGQPYDGWLIFFDELPAAAPAVQAAAYKILLDRQVVEYDLHPNVRMAAAGNLATDNAVAEDMSTALQSRLAHATMEVNQSDWIKWATQNGIDTRIISFIEWKPGLLYQFDPDHTDDTFACPRTWEFVDKLFKAGFTVGKNPDFERKVLQGIISEGPAREFIAFLNFYNKLPSLDQILANPEGFDIPQEPGLLYAAAGMVAGNITVENAAKLFKFLEKLPTEYQLVSFRTATARNKELAKIPEIMQWCVKNASSLF